jgi:hypothetical protein
MVDQQRPEAVSGIEFEIFLSPHTVRIERP